MRYLIIILCCLNVQFSCSQNQLPAMKQNIGNDTVEVYDVVKQLAELMIARDTAAMASILDKGFTLTHITGYVQPKAEWLNEVARESMKYYSAQEVNHTININGKRADVTIRNMVDARIWGSRNTWRLKQKMRLEKRNGNWVILYSIASTF